MLNKNFIRFIMLILSIFFGLLALFLPGFALIASASSVVNSKHNLSVSGPGTVKAISETGVCIFCHAPHNATAEAPLWNRYSSGATYTPYSSSTAQATMGQPTGASKLCLSCHDGTIALGLVRSRDTEISFNGSSTLPPGVSNLGTDLSDDHPISFPFNNPLYTQDGQLNNPALLTGAVKLDSNENLQCTSCHNPHDNQYGKFLVMDNRASAMCTACHNPTGWTGTVHRTSTATWNGQLPDPWPHTAYTTVFDNACENCHLPHSAGGPARLMNNAISEENCFPCHDGNVAQKDIKSEFNKISVHPIADTDVHDPTEDLINPPRHVECVDCHDSHAANAVTASAPYASGALVDVKGVNSSGSEVNEITFQYELCFRCHADSLNKGAPLVNRQFVETNTRLETSLSNQSYHPIVGVGKNPNVPSLISPYTTSSIIYCTDCHNNDQGPNAGGAGPNGPHGSIYAPILERQLLLTDYSPESPANYALCYKCHSRTNILNNKSFPYHKLHIVTVRASCTTCHDPHGVAGVTHLINFNTDYVTKNSRGQLKFVDNGTYHGTCYLSCHGRNHGGMGMGKYSY
ncbi:MAG: hypothetical protein GXO98_03300 [Nitrospirae bacterium]|nr:hypothetical protein [Nitrospirota bacterium]